jgi:hypothetical protein
MKQSKIFKIDASPAFIWIHDWFLRIAAEDLKAGYDVKNLTPHFSLEDFSLHEWLAEFPRESLKLTDQEYSAISQKTDQDIISGLNKFFEENASIKGKISGIFPLKEQLAIWVYAKYSVGLSAQSLLVEDVRIQFPIISIKCYDVGQNRTQIISYCFPESESLLDQIWQEIPFGAEENDVRTVKANGSENDEEQRWKPWEYLIEANDQQKDLLRMWCIDPYEGEELIRKSFYAAPNNVIYSLRKKNPHLKIPKGKVERKEFRKSYQKKYGIKRKLS